MTTHHTGQALVEFALILPVLLFILLAIIEMGSFGARWIRWQSLASQAAAATVDGTLPAWTVPEALRASCGAPVAILTAGDPPRVTLACEYRGIAVNGLVWRVTAEAVAPVGAVLAASASPEPSGSVAP